MLRQLSLRNVGPAAEMSLDFGERLNIITGDNGLGKSFILDVAWWALTRRWPHDLNPKLTSGYRANPRELTQQATIAYRLASKTKKDVSYSSEYVPRDEAWSGRAGRPSNPGLVIYAHADGGFSVWDPARNYWKKSGDLDVQERLPGYTFSAQEVWDGLEAEVGGKRTVLCNGLVRDWAGWVLEGAERANALDVLLRDLSTAKDRMSIGPLVRLSVNDARDIPSIDTSYAKAIPILFASAGVRRIAALAYVLRWAWQEHVIAAKKLGEEPTTRLVMLFDEIESHLHPRWQRSILKSVLDAAGHLSGEMKIQFVLATHSPLVMASAEPLFDPSTDAWFDLDLETSLGGSAEVVLRKRNFVRRGTAGRWLTSDAFNLESEGRSLEAEAAISAAERLLDRRRAGEEITATEVDKVTNRLRATLPDVDGAWVRWSALVEELKGGP